ncbi:MAG TPA: hypothetical protein DD666_03230 [Advenella kashmirensis]|uniref:Uncharacterized protein n=1 Tax=Advenella kashmirensis TaxID=310575 RepID=A0A356LBW5_9BURK|nr:hypothetical protein [Advenella kashmirensis]
MSVEYETSHADPRWHKTRQNLHALCFNHKVMNRLRLISELNDKTKLQDVQTITNGKNDIRSTLNHSRRWLKKSSFVFHTVTYYLGLNKSIKNTVQRISQFKG